MRGGLHEDTTSSFLFWPVKTSRHGDVFKSRGTFTDHYEHQISPPFLKEKKKVPNHQNVPRAQVCSDHFLCLLFQLIVLWSTYRKYPVLFWPSGVGVWLAVRIPWQPCDEFSKFYRPGRSCNFWELFSARINHFSITDSSESTRNPLLALFCANVLIWSCNLSWLQEDRVRMS